MLITEYFQSGIKQRSAALRIDSYLADKAVDYKIYYNMENLEEKLSKDKELSNTLDTIILKKYYSPGFFKDNKYIFVKLEGKSKEYKDILEDNIDHNTQNFVDESIALNIQDDYLESLSQYIIKEFQNILDDKKLEKNKLYEK